MASSPDWRNPADYAWLEQAGRQWFAWEWLRRSEAYRRHWRDAGAERRFGLVRCEDPALSALEALPLWSASAEPSVLVASAVACRASVGPGSAAAAGEVTGIGATFRRRSCAEAGQGIAAGIEHCLVNRLARQRMAGGLGSGLEDRAGHDGVRTGLWTVDLAQAELLLRALQGDGVTHLLLGDAAAPIRVDLLGEEADGAVVPVWHIVGLRGISPQLAALRRLIGVVDGVPVGRGRAIVARTDRHILTLRCADAIAAGASQQAIARGLFGNLVAEERWRVEASSARSRVQRLVQGVREMEGRDARKWFGEET